MSQKSVARADKYWADQALAAGDMDKYNYYMGGYNYHAGKPDTGGLKGLFNNPIIQPVLDAIAIATGNPELIPVINAGATKLGGGSWGDTAKSGALSFAGQELLPVAGNAFQSAFPETASSLGITGGGNSLTDLFGQTSGQGSFAGPGTIGGDLSGNFAPGSGLASLFGSATPSVGSGLTGDFASGAGTPNTNLSTPDTGGAGGTPTNDLFTNAARADTSAAAATPSSSLFTAGSPSTGAPSIGGGSAGGFVGDTGGFGGDLTSDFGKGILNPDASTAFGSNLSSGATGFADTLGSPATSTAASSGGKSMLSNLFGNSQLLPNLLRGGAGLAMSNDNNKGYNAQINAGGQIKQDYAPFMKAGTTANNTLADLYGDNGPAAAAAATQNWQNTPGYQFTKNQGIQALDASAAARGGLLSGNQQKAVQDYGTGLAGTYYQQYLQNLQNQAAAGQSAAGGVASGQAGIANAQMGKSGAKANTQNTGLTQILSALFPQNSVNIGGVPLNFASANQGLFSLFGNA